MKVTFLGATRQVTGSMFLLEFDNDYKILIDCGLDFDRKKTAKKKSLFTFSPKDIDVLILTHAHLDHSGNIPNLVKEGFEGRIYSTYATYELSSLLLADGANLNQRALKQLNKKEAIPNYIYLARNVQDALELFISRDFDQETALTDSIKITFKEAGHLLGAASIILEYTEKEETKRILFSGDIGRTTYPLLVSPAKLPPVDYMVCETTYGNRIHRDLTPPSQILREIIQETCVDKPGRLIIPAFSVGRTQALLFELNKLYVEKKLPPVKVFADSPLALKSTQVYRKYVRDLNEEANTFYDKHKELFDFENLHYVNDMKSSELISNYHEPCIIISSSGMVEGGRIEHHIYNNIENQYATILFIGYCSEDTFGYELLQKPEYLRTKGKSLKVMADIRYTDIFSGHGDQNDLKKFITQQSTDTKVFLVHGEETIMADFQETLNQEGYKDVEMPCYQQSYEL